MPKRNENAFHSDHEKRLKSWNYGSREKGHLNSLIHSPRSENSRFYGYRDLRSFNPLLTPNSELRTHNCLKVTGESIVKEFRQKEREKSNSTFQPYRVIPQSPPSFVRRFFNRINWGQIFEVSCWGAAIIAIIMISGLIVFGPFMVKEFWK